MSKLEYYWSISITPAWVQAGIWTIDDAQAKVISISPPARWEQEEDLVTIIDSTLSAAVDDLPDDADEPSKTVFGVAPSWVENGSIKKEHLVNIRHICSKLELEPSGFVVHPEAIAHSIKATEGAPLTGIIIGVEDNNLDVTLFRLGNLVGTVNVGRSVSLAEDLIEALTRFGETEPLPSRLLLYDGKESLLEDIKQKLHEFDWKNLKSDKISFLHTPKVEIVTPESKLMAVSLAGATEMGVVEGVSMMGKEPDKPVVGLEDVNDNIKATSLSPEDVGFVLDEDITVKESKPLNQEGKDELPHAPKSKIPKLPLAFLGNLKPKRPGRGNASPHISSLKKGGKKKLLYAFASLPFVAIAAVVVLWWYVPKAQIVIFVSPQTLEEVHTVTLDQSASGVNAGDLIVAAKEVSVEVSGEKSKNATGAKTIGEKAGGNVRIENGTSQPLQLNAGSILEGPNNLEFEVVESASVSAATTPSSPGTATVEISALDIGAEYNLGKDEILSVGNYVKGDVAAIVEDGLGGGSSEDITAVSESDLEDLVDELTQELLKSGESQIGSKVGAASMLLPGSGETSTTKKTFSHKAGDEASSISLNLTLEITILTVDNENMTELAKAVLEDKIPEGFVLRPEQIKYEFDLEDEDDGVWYFDTTFILNLLPDVNPDEVQSKVAGKSPASAESLLQTIPGYKGSEIKISPPLPSILGNIPRNTKNISVEIEAQK